MKRFLLAIVVIAVLSMGAGQDWVEYKLAELEQRIEVLENKTQPTTQDEGTFSGYGSGNTMPFTVANSPWAIEWKTVSSMPRRPIFGIHVYDMDSKYIGGYGGQVSENVTYGSSVSYIPAGTYYLKIDSDYYIHWVIWIK